MKKYWLNVALIRIFFPVILIGCTIWRPVGLSLIYLVLALISPMVSVPTTKSMNGRTGHFLKISIGLSFLLFITQLTFHIVLMALPPYGHFLKNCTFLETLLRHIGLVRLDKASIWEVFFWIVPEFIVFPLTTLIYSFCRQFTTVENKDDEDISFIRFEKKSKEQSSKIINILGTIGNYIVLATLCCTASLKPSIEGALYFIVFIGSATWWALHRELRYGFAVICRILMFIVAVHIVVLLSYQNQWPQEFLPINGTWARYFGLVAVYKIDCSNSRDVKYKDKNDWLAYAYSLRMFILYFALALQSKFLMKKPAKQRTRLSGKLETLDTPLSRHVSVRKRTPSQRWQSARRKARLMRFGSGRTGLLQDSTGSVIVQDAQQEDNIQMQSLSEGISEEKPGILEHVIMAVFSIFQLIVNSSYLAANIIMMTWSIMYHSWTTFALLLWALILWIVPSKRVSMMKCSPFIVLYSTLLLLIQYVYSMDLTEDELPTIIHGIKMSDIGFKKTNELSCWHLIVKCIFMTMFWITLRQYMDEKMRQKRSTISDMTAPLHVTVSAATNVRNNRVEPEIKSPFMKDVGIVVKKFLTKFWIAVVAIMLFTSGITGERMTVFRIVYMSLFLLFIITFQISWSVWRKMMYGFWITIIGYSVIMLILVYTYQFPDFPEYWEKYFYISRNLQEDIGLITYDTKDLFVRLLTPTFFVIITVLQIHYFHEDFLEITNIKRNIQDLRKSSLGHSPSAIPIIPSSEVFRSDNVDDTRTYNLKELKRMSKLERIAFLKSILGRLYRFYNNVWLFIEIHMQKIIHFSFMLLCIHDVCAINFCFILALCISINFRRSIQIMIIKIMAVAIAVLMVIKMLYQIDYIKHENWDRNCTEFIKGNATHNGTNVIKTYNMAEWLGLQKVDENLKLPKLLEGYIGIIVVTTFRAIIVIRQWFHRRNNNEPLETPLVMFPEIKRADADKDLISCFKFLLNYGFYKFGLEFCLMGIVALIGTRLDFYSFLYSIWLIVLFSLNRKSTLTIWPFFKMFTIILLPLQYASAIAPPTWFCIDYPWRNSEVLERLQEWMYLPDPNSRPNPKKLMCDFILLLMIVRQSLVFRIEYRSALNDQEFIAGHNNSVYREMDKINFVNPIKDYVSHIHSWLDVFKRGCMMSLMWITLSIMFLAGTKRTNLFSLGYLIGSFIFLWQGSDFYLRPVRTILKWWNVLIGYNIFVIFCKTVFQGIGCVFIHNLETYACWCIQLLGIACLKKFNVIDDQFKSSSSCEVDREDIGMVWDGLCFGFLLIQKRLFRSYYFFHIVDETKAMSILASRGAELLEELHQKRILEQENLEKKGLQKIKFKMDKIKANQRKIHGPVSKQIITHKIGGAPLARTSSMSSCISSTHTPPQGYQTPIDDDEDEPPPLTPCTASLLQAPSPHSAVMTVSLEGYLEPTRISFGSPPSSDLNPRGPSPDETFPVFSPPPYNRQRCVEDFGADKLGIEYKSSQRKPSSHADISWNNASKAPRRSIVSSTSRSPRSHHTYSLYKQLERPLYRHQSPKSHLQAIRSGDYYMFDDMDDDDLTDLFPEKEILPEEEVRPPEQQQQRRMTVSELMNTVKNTDIEIATHVALSGGSQLDAMKIRRSSVPLTRKKSSVSYQSAHSETDTAATTDLPQQSTLHSGDEDATENQLDEDLETSEKPGSKDETHEKKISFLTYFSFIWVFINSFMVSMTRQINNYSNDYRYVRKILAKEKKLLKAKPNFRLGTRFGINQIWHPLPIVQQRSNIIALQEDDQNPDKKSIHKNEPTTHRTESSLLVPRIQILASSLDQGLDISNVSNLFSHIGPNRDSEEHETVLSEVDQPPIIQLAASIWFAILAHSTFLCYFMVFLHQIRNASILSTPLPLMVFLWGSLTIPRPSKTFWVTIIAYVEVIVIIKCMCQPAFLSWNKKEMSSYPFEVPRFLGVERKPNYALWDLLLLLVVFFHRFMLKSLGQWTKSSMLKPRKKIPSGFTVATMKKSNAADGDKVNAVTAQNTEQFASTSHTHDEIITPKGMTLTLLVNGEGDRDINSPAFNEDEKIVVIQASEGGLIEQNLKRMMSLTILRYLQPFTKFFEKITDPSGKERTNVYAYMFLCDFFNFILLIFGFSSFGAQQGDGGVATYFAENRVPMPFLLMLLLQFALIVIDRALFLKKSIAGKLTFHYCLVIGIHIWMFIILPSATERQFNTKVIPQIWYMVKCFYLLFAAYQLRFGYPTRILGNFLCKKYSFVNYILFRGFMVVPFLFEMRAVMDWIWTDTSMTVMDWFKMEDIFANIYQIKCMRGMESDYPQQRGVKKNQITKYIVGGIALFLMIGMIWFPLLIFAFGGTVGISNLPYEMTLSIKIGSYEPIYTISAQNSSIFQFSKANFNDFKELYEIKHRDRSAVTFLENYVNTDVAAVKMSTQSGKIWNISPPDRQRMIKELKSDNIMIIHVEWTVSRKPASKDTSGVTSNSREILLDVHVNGTLNPIRTKLINIISNFADLNTLNNLDESNNIILQNLLPMFLKVTSKSITVVPQLTKPLMHYKIASTIEADEEESENYLYRDVKLSVMNNSINQVWFGIKEACNDSIYNKSLNEIPLNDCSFIVMYLFNDKVFPEGLSFISGLGIFGLYTTAVILVSSFIKRMVSDMAPKIMFEDLPYVDRILRLCLDIYLVRESGDLCLEEDLFAKLIFLYRSPETLIKWTRLPEPSEQIGGDVDGENYNAINDQNDDDDNDDRDQNDYDYDREQNDYEYDRDQSDDHHAADDDDDDAGDDYDDHNNDKQVNLRKRLKQPSE